MWSKKRDVFIKEKVFYSTRGHPSRQNFSKMRLNPQTGTTIVNESH